VRRRV